jgi:hypothetical protein
LQLTPLGLERFFLLRNGGLLRGYQPLEALDLLLRLIQLEA